MLSRIILTTFLILFAAEPASSWGWQGHQYIGNLAFELLNPNARRHVRQLLGAGVDLGHGAVWADCVRSIDVGPAGALTYQPDRYTPKVCGDFTVQEQARMISYASNNWTNCKYKNALRECHKSFHFADVNVRAHLDYDRSYFGTGDEDVVQAIKAALIVLKCKTGQTCLVPPPFHLSSKREALLLLSHMTGDLHQPLHVGAIYLDGAGVPGSDSGQATGGGNLLLVSAGDDGSNLHHEWDTVLKSITVTPSPLAISQGCAIAPLPNPTPEPVEKWAGESVIAAATAYSGMSFIDEPSPDLNGYWDIIFVKRADYLDMVRRTQAIQLIRGGARLAILLNSVWPSSKAAPKC